VKTRTDTTIYENIDDEKKKMPMDKSSEKSKKNKKKNKKNKRGKLSDDEVVVEVGEETENKKNKRGKLSDNEVVVEVGEETENVYVEGPWSPSSTIKQKEGIVAAEDPEKSLPKGARAASSRPPPPPAPTQSSLRSQWSVTDNFNDYAEIVEHP